MLKLGELIFRPDPEVPPKLSVKLAELPTALTDPVIPVTKSVPTVPPTAPLVTNGQIPIDAVPVVDEAAMIVDIDDTGAATNGDAHGKLFSLFHIHSLADLFIPQQ